MPTPVGPSRAKVPIGPAGILEVGPGPAQGFAECGHGFALADHDLAHLLLNLEQALHFTLFHALERNARPLGDHVEDVFLVHFDALFLAGGAPFLQDGFQLFLGLLFLVAHGGGALEILVLDGPFLLGLDVLDFGFEFLDFRRAGHGPDAGARAGFIHQVDGLVRAGSGR